MDLRLKFEMEAAEYTERTCIFVVELNRGGESALVGIVVDIVSAVLNIRRSADLEESPSFGTDLITISFGSGEKLKTGSKFFPRSTKSG